MNNNDPLGDRMKSYERIGSTSDRFLPTLPVIVRLDGRAFHSFTRGLERPFDSRLSALMVGTTKHLVQESNAVMGYTQSDEITLILHSDDPRWKRQIYFDGRRDKIVSVLASCATAYFNLALPHYIPSKAAHTPLFDCRAFNVPSKTEAVNCLIWREQDASRNSVSMAAQSRFSHKRLHGLSCDEMQELLFTECGINWNDYPAFFKRGSYIQRRTATLPFTTDEMEKLPPKHAARENPDLKVERQDVLNIAMPRLAAVINREVVVFEGVEPISTALAPQEAVR